MEVTEGCPSAAVVSWTPTSCSTWEIRLLARTGPAVPSMTRVARAQGLFSSNVAYSVGLLEVQAQHDIRFGAPLGRGGCRQRVDHRDHRRDQRLLIDRSLPQDRCGWGTKRIRCAHERHRHSGDAYGQRCVVAAGVRLADCVGVGLEIGGVSVGGKDRSLLPTAAWLAVEQPASVTIANPTTARQVATTALRIRSMMGTLSVHSPTHPGRPGSAPMSRVATKSRSGLGRTTCCWQQMSAFSP